MMLSKTTEYALRAAACMGTHSGRPVSANDLAKQTLVPRRYLTRVLQDLTAGGLVRSRPGPGGGYQLSQANTELSMLDVVNSVDKIERIRECPLHLKTHPVLCPLHQQIDRVYGTAERILAGITIQDLVDSSETVVPLCETSSNAESAHDAAEPNDRAKGVGRNER